MKKSAPVDTFERLEAKRREFEQFVATSVRPLIQLSDTQFDLYGYVELAELIEVREIRRKYAQQAIELLDANIAHYRPDATRIDVAPPNYHAVVASTLVAAGIAYYFGGAFAAFIWAAAWYWFVAETVRERHVQDQKAAQEHNAEVKDWAKTLSDWQDVRTELQRHL